ncbi:hypothetical protein NQ317_015363 [Molorchus minor]|uniref:Uncharacterized protein n=1 Tax=Molorchus minor TaxID=1323400 RepID=A0ABQ9J7K5_9CUCU|nr:hypothetical protein NQ317_015363 [Molorchus minor]
MECWHNYQYKEARKETTRAFDLESWNQNLLSADDAGPNSVENEILKYMITNKKLFSKVLSALEDVGGKVDILTERVQQLTNNIPEEVINVRSFTDTFPLNNKNY